MTVYFIATYDIVDAEKFAEYNPGSLGAVGAVFARHGIEVLGSGEVTAVRGAPASRGVLLRAPSRAAIEAWLNDPAYAHLAALRDAATGDETAFVLGAVGAPRRDE